MLNPVKREMSRVKAMKSAKKGGRRTVKSEGTMRNRRAEADFGTYHHSTPEESNDIRARAEQAFSKLLRRLFPSDAPLRILDAGCGLGFLVYVAAKCFPKAQVIGVDLFKHNSLAKMSIEKAEENMMSLGIGSRTSFVKHDLTKPLKSDAEYDLVVSNLVFHNLGNKRFQAYGHLFDALKPGGYFVIGDVYRDDRADVKCFREHATLVKEFDAGQTGPWVYRIRVLRKA